MSDPTAARTRTPENGHWYSQDGKACYEVPCKSRPGEMRATTLADARKLLLLPSVTTILRVLHKQGLVDWLIEQSCLAVLTTPRQPGEALDAFVERVLHTERQQDAESQAARDRGTAIHDAIERWFSGQDTPTDLRPWIEPAARAVSAFGHYVTAEKILVGEGYAGKTDLILENTASWIIVDFKSAKKLPDPARGGAWPEHRLQLAAYAAAFHELSFAATPTPAQLSIRTLNCYISSVEQGQFVICEHEDWQRAYNSGFAPLVQVWCWLNNYNPNSPIKPI